MSYDHNSIEVIDHISHIQINPTMYIGSTETPTHLLEECFDNSLDECLGKHADIVAINMDTKNNEFSVIDNGRGIPIEKDMPKVVSYEMFSGAKFKGRKTAYEISSGLHGVGLVAVNALSEKYIVEVYRNKRHAIYEFNNAKLIQEKKEEFTGEPPFSTRILFKPMKNIFEELLPSIERIRERLFVASVEMPKVKFVLIIDNKKEVINISKQNFFKEYCLANGDKDCTPIIEIFSDKSPELFRASFCYSFDGSSSPKIRSSVNLLPVQKGGTHVNLFIDLLREFFISKAKKYNFKFQPNCAICGLRGYFSLSLVKPDFSGQTKDSLTNKKTDLVKFIPQLKTGLEDFFKDHEEDLLIPLLTHMENYQRRLDSKKIITVDSNRRVSVKYTKLRDCNKPNGELFIVEGQSAGGSLIQARDPSLHAILPLKGKPPSTINKDILQNKEMFELIQSIGTGYGPDFNIDNIRYNKIICAADADDDGFHIFCLLTLNLVATIPEIIKKGFYYLAMTPLFAINKKTVFTPLWTKDELEKARKNNEPISRFKGLGELTPQQLKKCLLDEKNRRLIQIEYSENIEDMFKLFSDAEEKRSLIYNQDIKIEEMF